MSYDLVPENYRAIASLVGEKQYEYVQAGKTQVEARLLALREVGASLNPPVQLASDLEYWMGQCLTHLYQNEDGASLSKPTVKRRKKSKAKDILKRYRAWADEHNIIARDNELSLWAECSKGAFGFARKVLSGEGYRFEILKGRMGWRVTQRPAPGTGKTYSEAEVKAMMEEYGKQLLSQYGKERK